MRVSGDDWAAVRAVRLAALAESPAAFGSSLSREQEYGEDRWRAWTTSAAVFLLTEGGEPGGVAASVGGGPGEARALVSVWVQPAWRGQGRVQLLLERVEEWAREQGARRLELWLTRGNLPARRAYERRGYVGTGRSKPLPSNPELVEDEMVLDLT